MFHKAMIVFFIMEHTASTTVDKAIDLLFELSRGEGPQGVTALARSLELPKASVHRLLATLTRRELIERDERRRYSPGPALLALGLQGLDRDPIAAASRVELEAAANELGETVFLAAPRGGKLLVLDKAEGTGFLRAAPRVGEAIPIHATAVGKLVLAHEPEAVSLGGERLAAFTEQTVTTHERLEAEVERAALRGWAENRGEWITGLSVVAAPVFRGDRMVAALAVAAATARVDDLGALPLAERLRAAAARIAARLELPRRRPRNSAAPSVVAS